MCHPIRHVRLHHSRRLGMIHLAAVVIVVNDYFVAPLALLHRDPREERAKLVILILRPLLEGMIVALVAIEAYAQERLADVLGDFSGLAQRPVVIHFRRGVAASL